MIKLNGNSNTKINTHLTIQAVCVDRKNPQLFVHCLVIQSVPWTQNDKGSQALCWHYSKPKRPYSMTQMAWPTPYTNLKQCSFWWCLWHYRLWSFQGRDTKLERFLAKNQHAQRNFLNFENWTNGKYQQLAKISFFQLNLIYF